MDRKCFSEDLFDCPRLYPCLSALAMGDNQAVELGQLAHIQLGFQARFSPSELVVVHGRAPRAAVAAGIFIDDVIFSEKAKPGMKAAELDSVRRLNLLREEYPHQGLFSSPKEDLQRRGVGRVLGLAR